MKNPKPLTLFAIAILTSCGVHKPISIDQKGADVFPCSEKEGSAETTMGDVMPFYDDGVMNIYHLRNVSGTNSLFYHPIARISSPDLIHYQNDGVALNYEESFTSIDAALGTGSFIKGKEGEYHCFYTGHNGKVHDADFGDKSLTHMEAIRHAVSHDGQKTWEKDEDFLIFGGKDDFRDPYVYWDAAAEKYQMLVTTRDIDTDEPVIRRYEAPSLSARPYEWVNRGNFFVNDEGAYNMECPSYLEYNGFQYLAYSEQGANRVTHYRYRRSSSEPWQRFGRDAIDSAGFYAGRLEKMEDRLYAFAWCARLTGGNTGDFDWGGNLVSHELSQNPETGELSPVMPHTYKEYFSHPVDYALGDGKFEFSGEKFEAKAIGKNSDNATRFSMKIRIAEDKGDFGLTFGIAGQLHNRMGDGTLTFNVAKKKISCHNNVSNVLRFGPELTSVAYPFELDKDYDVDLIVDGELYSVYLNGEVAMTARLTNMPGKNIAFYSNGAKASITEVKAYE